jgi:hypothetical protein
VRELAARPRHASKRWALAPWALATVMFACGREEADLLVPGSEAGRPPPVLDAPPLTDVVAPPDGDVMAPTADVMTPQDVAPCAGYAAQFTGTSSLSVPRPVQDDFTIEAWIKTTVSRKGTIFYHGNGLIYADAPPGPNPAGADDVGTVILNDRFAFGIGNPETTLESNTVVTTGQWVHVAATRNKAAGEAHVYVNGVDDGVTPTQKGSLTDQATLLLGCTLNDQNHFIGQMDEVRIWNVVRTGAEIAATMRQRLTGGESGLVAYWRFDDPNRTTAVDSSPRKADATIAGMLDWVTSDAPICGP